MLILIVDDEPAARHGLKRALQQPGVEILEANGGRAALDVLRSRAVDLVFLDLNMPGLGGQQMLRELSATGPGASSRAEIIVLTANDSLPIAVECMRLGAADFIAKPYEVEQVRAIARRTAKRRELEARVEQLETELQATAACGALVGASPPMRELFAQIGRAAGAGLDILIRGETGTGKELIAREIHRQGPRSAGPFVAVNTAAIAESLAESELFGHVRGAFTGAAADRAGVFEQAHGGTLFLDEIGDMPPPAQAKILRALQERAVQPVGGTRSVSVDVRVITATHQDLAQAIADGHFRQDLYYRIRGIEIAVPPLRHRRDDILLLANHLIRRRASADATPKSLTPAAVDHLLAHPWPGNVRELEQVVSAAAAMCSGDEIRPSDLGLPQHDGMANDPLDFSSLAELPLMEAKQRLVETFERRTIEAALKRHAGNVSAAARQLGLHRQSLQQKMAQLGIVRGE